MKWNFNNLRVGDEKQGIRDGDMSDFNKTHYKSVVRESIQNSLDARDDKTVPVVVNFSFFKLDKSYLNGFTEIESHIKNCINFSKNEDDKEFIESMISSFERDEYSCMEVADFNTIGMELQTTYDSFANSRNISDKKFKGSAGSKGMGKAVYFASSYLHSILVSSKAKTGESLFQGITKISSHEYDGILVSHKGFYGYDMTAIQDESLIPKKFIRDEVGTSIYIVGLKSDEQRKEEMIKELITNFWLAIYEGDLIVTIDGTEYNKNNIYDEIKARHSDLDESGQYNVFPNPRPYIETYLGIQNVSKEYRDEIEILGKVRLILAKNTHYPGRIAFYRKSKMLIYKDSSFIYKGYCGLFICDDDDGNEILKKLENAKHNEWKSGNWNDPRGGKAIKSYKNFLQECIRDFTEVEEGLDISIPELDKLLGLVDTGKTSGGVAIDSTGMMKKDKVKPVKRKTKPSDNIPKSFNWLRCKVEPIKDSFQYNISINSKVKDNDLKFEVLVGSDDKSGKNKVDILTSSNGSFNNNIISLNLNKGHNEVQLTLKDRIKHAIRLKEIKSEDYEN